MQDILDTASPLTNVYPVDIFNEYNYFVELLQAFYVLTRAGTFTFIPLFLIFNVTSGNGNFSKF